MRFLWLLLLPFSAFAGIIGQDDESGMGSNTHGATTPQQMMVSGTYTYTAPSGEEVFKFWAYQNVGAVGNDLEVGVYDISSGVDNATLVASGTITGTAATGVWLSVTITPVALTGGNEYAVAWRPTGSNGSFNLYRTAGGTTSREAALLGASPLPATWDEGTPFAFTYAVYAETQATSGGGGGSTATQRRARKSEL